MFGSNRPRALVCYICGREYGTTSLGIHIKACQKKWENQQIHKAPRQRRPCPKPPAGFMEMLNGKGRLNQKELDAFNEEANNNYRNQALMECQYCGRKFKPQSLVKHQKLCMKDPSTFKRAPPKVEQKQQPEMKVPSKGYDLSKAMYQDKGADVRLVSCRMCGRNFAQDRVAKHQKICKGQTKKQQKSPPPPPPSKGKKNDAEKGGKGGKDPLWKVQHEEFVAAMKNMRAIKKIQKEGGDIRSIPMVKGNYDHYIDCQYCGRKYAPDVAQRHIPRCANIVNKPKGITPSQIGSKYVGSSGVRHDLPKKVQSKPTPSKPQSKVQPPPKQNPGFGKVVKR